MSITACWPVWLLMMTSMPNRDTPSACRKDLDNSRMTSSLGGWDTPSTLSLWDYIFIWKYISQKTNNHTSFWLATVLDVPRSSLRTTLVWKRCGCWRKWLSCLKRETEETGESKWFGTHPVWFRTFHCVVNLISNSHLCPSIHQQVILFICRFIKNQKLILISHLQKHSDPRLWHSKLWSGASCLRKFSLSVSYLIGDYLRQIERTEFREADTCVYRVPFVWDLRLGWRFTFQHDYDQ